MINKSTPLALILFTLTISILAASLLTACNLPGASEAAPTHSAPAVQAPTATLPPTPTQAPTAAPLPFAGTWIDAAGNVLILDGSTYYYREIEKDYARETIAEIQYFDPAAGTIRMRYKTIRVNGKAGGFDAPTHNLRYEINGKQLRFGISLDETDIPSELKPQIFEKKP